MKNTPENLPENVQLSAIEVLRFENLHLRELRIGDQMNGLRAELAKCSNERRALVKECSKRLEIDPGNFERYHFEDDGAGKLKPLPGLPQPEPAAPALVAIDGGKSDAPPVSETDFAGSDGGPLPGEPGNPNPARA